MNTPPLILIHGAGCDRRLWPKELTSSPKITTYPLDLPGHGDRKGNGQVSIDSYVGWVLSFLEEKKIEKALFCGHSMGGAISQTIALNYPEKVSGLVLVSTGARLKVAPLFMAILKRRPLFWLALNISLHTSFVRNVPQYVRKLAKNMLTNSGQKVLYNDLGACLQFDVMNEVSKISVPTLIVYGNEDKLTPPKYSTYLNNQIKNSQLSLFEGVGHFPPIERGVDFTNAVLDWIAKTGW